MDKGSEKHLFNKNRGMINRHMRECSSSLSIRERKIKITMGYELAPLRMASIKIERYSSVKEDADKENPLALLVSMQIGATILENSRDGPQKY